VSTTRRPPAATTRRPSAAPRAPRPSAAPAGDAEQPTAALADAIWRYANAALEACWLIVAALLPLYLDLLRSQSGLARGPFLQVITAFMALLWLLQWTAGRRLAAPDRPAAIAAEADAASPASGASMAPAAGPSHGTAAGAPRLAVFAALAAAYAGTGVLAALLSPLPGIAFWGSYLRGDGAVAMLAYAVLFLVVADRLRRREQLDRLVSVLLAASVPVCLYAVAQGTGHDPWGPSGVAGRAVSTAGNAIFLAGYLILLVPLTVWRLLDDPRRRADPPRGSWLGPAGVAAAVAIVAGVYGATAARPQAGWAYPMLLAAFALVVATLPPLPTDALGQRARRGAYGGLLLLQLAALVFTASRGPLAGLVIALAVVAAVTAWRARRWRQLAVVGGLVLVVSGGLLALMAPASPLRPLADSLPLLQRIARVREDYSGARVVVWERATEALTRPELLAPEGDALGRVRLLVGYGPESVVYLLNRVLPPPRELGSVLGEFWDRTHNALLDRLLTTGLLGLAAYLALVVGIVAVTVRRAWPTSAPFGWSLAFALAVALLAHLVETQTSLLALPPEGIFWLLAGVVVAAPRLAAAPAPAAALPAGASAGRRDRRGSRGTAPAPPRAAGRRWVVGAYAAVAVLAALVMLQVTAVETVLAATLLQLGAVLAAALVGALAFAPAAGADAGPATGATGRALAVLGLAGVVALAVTSHQVVNLAAEVAFHRAELAQQMGNFPGAIRGAQAALDLAPDQAEYYHILGQYYGALAGETRTPPRAEFAPSLAAARGEAAPETLGRDQLFTLGQLSVEAAIQRNRLEARYYATLGELYRYWAEVAGEPAHLSRALASFEQARALKPNDVEIHAGLSDTLLLAGDATRALAEGQRAEGLLPGYWYTYAVTARAALAVGDSTTALQAAGDALQYTTSSLGIKAPSPYEIERLREVVSQAVASGTSPVRPGIFLRNKVSSTLYQIDEQGRARVLPLTVAASCPEVLGQAYPLPDAILPLLPPGPELTTC